MAYKECKTDNCDLHEYFFEEFNKCPECGNDLLTVEDLHVALSGKPEKIEVDGLVKMKAGGQLPPKTQVWRRKWGKEAGWREVEESVFSKIWEDKPKEGTPREEEDLPPLPPDVEPKMKESDPGVEVGKTVAGGDLQQNISVNTEGGGEASGKGGDGAPDQGIQTGKVLAGGDVVQNISQTSHTNVYNQDESTKDMTCCVSGHHGVPSDGGDCSKCKGWALKEHFNTENKRCNNCEKEISNDNERKFRSLIVEFLEDHQISKEEMVEIDSKARDWEISGELKKRILQEEKDRDAQKFSDAMTARDRMILKQAKNAFEIKNDPEAAFGKLKNLVEGYPKNKELGKLFALVAVEADPEKGFEFLENSPLFQGIDSPVKSVRKLEMLLAAGRDDEADEVERKEFRRFENDRLIQAKELERLIDQYFDDEQEEEERQNVLDEASTWSPPSGEDDEEYQPFLHFVDAYLRFFKEETTDLNPSSDSDPAKVFLLRKQRSGIGVSATAEKTEVVGKVLAGGDSPTPTPFDLPPPADFSGVKNGTYENGDRYEGNWKDGKRDGLGTLVSDISRYEGYWKEDKKSGLGKESFEDDSKYDGEYLNDCFHGLGKFLFSDGRRYEGEVSQDKWNGRGKLFSADGNLLYDGEWKDNKRHGQGKEWSPDGQLEYEGKFQEGFRKGEGKEYLSDGRRFEGIVNKREWVKGVLFFEIGSILDRIEGQWKDGSLYGLGRSYYADGKPQYEGHYEDGERHGRGTFTFNEDEVTLEGMFYKGQMHGTFIRTYPDGRTVTEQWENGKAVTTTPVSKRKVSNRQEKETQTIRREKKPNFQITRTEAPSHYIGIANQMVSDFWKTFRATKGKIDLGQFKGFMLEKLARHWNGLSSVEEVPGFNPTAWNQMISDSGGVQAKSKVLAKLIPELVYPDWYPKKKSPILGLFLCAVSGPLGFLYSSKKWMYTVLLSLILIPPLISYVAVEAPTDELAYELWIVSFFGSWMSLACIHPLLIDARNRKLDQTWAMKEFLGRTRFLIGACFAFIIPIGGTIAGWEERTKEEFEADPLLNKSDAEPLVENSTAGDSKNNPLLQAEVSTTRRPKSVDDVIEGSPFPKGIDRNQGTKVTPRPSINPETERPKPKKAYPGQKEYLEASKFFYGLQGAKVDKQKSLRLFRESATLGNPNAAYQVGLCLLLGDGVPKNMQAAKEWLEHASKIGSKEAAKALRDYSPWFPK